MEYKTLRANYIDRHDINVGDSNPGLTPSAYNSNMIKTAPPVYDGRRQFGYLMPPAASPVNWDYSTVNKLQSRRPTARYPAGAENTRPLETRNCLSTIFSFCRFLSVNSRSTTSRAYYAIGLFAYAIQINISCRLHIFISIVADVERNTIIIGPVSINPRNT